MIISDVLFAKGVSGFYFDDQMAIRNGAEPDGLVYKGEPATAGFTQVRQPGESVSILLVLEDGRIAGGDCAAVQYSGAGGRDPLFLADTYMDVMKKHLKPLLLGRKLGAFREMSAMLDDVRVEGRPLHTAIRYGASLAILDAVASSSSRMPCEVICDEYELPTIAERVPLMGQTGDNRYESADKMILKQVDALPHGLFNNVAKLGRDGAAFREYLRWVVARIAALKNRDSYNPVLHFDVYGTIGLAFDNDLERVSDFMASLEEDCGGLELFVEGPVDMGCRDGQIDAMSEISRRLAAKGSAVKIVADEWCNTFEDVKAFTDARACHMVQIKTPDLGGAQHTVESVLYCRENGVMPYQGGTCNETDFSARHCIHLAMAARAERFLCKPGMGFDEAFMIANNEMERIIAVLRSREA